MLKITLQLFFLCITINILSAQTTLIDDNFEDGNITGWTEGISGHWTASTTTPLDGSYSLKHNLSGISGNSYITQQFSINPQLGNVVWQWQWKNGDWDPSSANKFWFYLMSDQQNIGSGTQDGYAVGLNLFTADDQIKLFRITNGAFDAVVINAGSSYDVNNLKNYGFKVERNMDGQWELFIDSTGGFDNLISIGTATDTTYQPVNPYCGLYFEFSSSRAGTLWMDDVNITTTEGTTPVVDLSVSQTSVREGKEITITVTSTAAVDSDKIFSLTTSGTATSGSDYTALPSTITIQQNEHTATTTLQTKGDSIFESTETVNIQLGKNGQSNVTMGDTISSVSILDNVRAMHYNLLRYPSSSNISTKNSYLKKIISYVQPDIFGVNELDSDNGDAYSDSILNGTLNVDGETKYKRAFYSYTSGSPISNMLFYNSQKFELHSQDSIMVPNNRQADVYQLFYKYPNLSCYADTVFLTVIQTHLKAGNTSADSLQRVEVSDSIMSYLKKKGEANWLLMGDFNLYTSDEQAFQNFTNYAADTNVRFNDPLNQPGDWDANSAFASIHTQSPRKYDLGDGGAPGGLDDRFDFILISKFVKNNTDSIQYIDGTYTVLGQDGQHFNLSVDSPANTSVSVDIADALKNMSDHLPVFADFQIGYPTADTIRWTGINGTDWNDSGNWDKGMVPASCNVVVIPGTAEAPTQPTISATANCKSIIIYSPDGAQVTISGSGMLNVAD